MTWPIVSMVIFMPFLGALIIALILYGTRMAGKPAETKLYMTIASFFSGLAFLFSLPLFFLFQPGVRLAQFVERVAWIPAWGVEYYVGLDSLSLLLFGLTAFLTPLAILAAWGEVREHVPAFCIAMLVMETTLLGVFAARDLILFYVFWEFSLVPMFIIIYRWGGPRRRYAAMKFFLYTFIGSLFMLVGILVVYQATGSRTFAWDTLLARLQSGYALSPSVEMWLFLAFAVAFLVKVPAVPFHTWLPAAHVEAPTPGSVLLAGVLLKMGAYGLIRFCIPFFPHATERFQWPMVVLGVVGILYGSWAALAQRDIKRLVAYSSVAHLGVVLVGLFALTPQAVRGAILQMVNHGISTGALFVLVGILYRRRHTRDMDAFGGLARTMPGYFFCFLIITLASVGLPLTNGFVGEFLVFWGAFKRYPLTTAIAVTGVIWSVVYMLRLILRVFFGPVTHEENKTLPDLTRLEWGVLVPLLVAVFVIGLYPGPFLKRSRAMTWLKPPEETARRFERTVQPKYAHKARRVRQPNRITPGRTGNLPDSRETR